jgi:hypothetical protein
MAAEPAPGQPAPGQEAIETPVFRLDVPKDWQIETRGPPVQVRGPNSELMFIEVVSPEKPEAASPDELERLQAFWKEKITNTLEQEVVGTSIVEEFTESTIDGRWFLKAKGRREDRGIFVGAYGLLDHSGVAFTVTVAGWVKDEATAESTAELMLQAIIWKRRQ